MQQALYLSSVITGIPFFIKTTTLLIWSIFRKDLILFKKNDYSEDLLVASILFVFLFFFSFIILEYGNSETISGLIVGGLPAFFIPVIQFVVPPLKYFFASKEHSFSEEYSDKVRKMTKMPIRVYLLNQDIINAFATGVLPFSRMILLGKPLLEKMSESESDAIIGHEIGHIEKRHILKLMLISATWSFSITLIFSLFINPQISKLSYAPMYAGIYYGLLAGASMFFMSFFQKRYEYEADAHAAKLAGVPAIKQALIKLNEELNGKMTQWSLTHPTLAQRLGKLDNLK